MFRRIVVLAAMLVSAKPAAAQITTYIAPARPSAESRELIATADSTRRDSVQRAAVTNMAAWVDSAAGIAVPTTVGLDSTDPGRPLLVDSTLPAPVTTFANGSVAPATASLLPALLLVGVVVFGAGLVLLARPRG